MMGSFQNWLATAITCSAEHCLGEGGEGVEGGWGGLVVLGGEGF